MQEAQVAITPSRLTLFRTVTKASFTTLALTAAIGTSSANALDVWVEFGSAFETGLNAATSSAGVSSFTAGERATIEANILSDLNTIYTGYNLAFSTSDPGGTREQINFGATTTSGGALGVAPLDFGNLSSFGGSSSSSARVFTANFDFFIESFEPRSQQIAEISRGLAGTGAHELLHSLGARHYNAYSDPSITPSTYAATGGVQNNYVIATGSTGLGEVGRETLRTISPWSKVILDVTGGLTVFGGTPASAVTTPIVQEFESGDAGATLGTAQALTMTTGETSGAEIGLVFADLDSTTSDVDLYSFTTDGPGSVTAEIWSLSRLGASFDATLTLFDTDGTTVLLSNDNAGYSGNTFNIASNISNDPFLLNAQLDEAGTYYLEVKATSPGSESVGDDYFLLVGADVVPEPSSLAFLAMGGLLAARRRRG
ncbi:MAG: DVUA0089 family protein [Phycisphaeraceae bacterium]